MDESKSFPPTTWLVEKHRQRARRALARQLEYQEKKAAGFTAGRDEIMHGIFLRAQAIRRNLETVDPIAPGDKILEVGSGAHGLVFGFGNEFSVGIDPLAVQYRRLFPQWQENARTIAAIGENLPFDDLSFDVVLSDNVVDHAEDPVQIIHELVRVLRPGGLLYFTVNIHHRIYDLASRAHGAWNAIGIKFELSPFADHTVHFTEGRLNQIFATLPLNVIQQNTTVDEMKAAYRRPGALTADRLLKRVFFKNALYEIVAVKR